MRVAVIAALPGELAPLVANWRRVKTGSPTTRRWVKLHGANEWVAVCAGMGADAARRAFAEAERDGTFDMIISMGWAGALTETLTPETVLRPATVIDAQTGESFFLVNGEQAVRLVTTQGVASIQEKLRLNQSYAAAAVDMEAATLARLAAMRGIPMACVKAISDERDAVLPDLNRFIGLDGQMRMLPFLAHVAVSPGFWLPLMKLGRHSAAGARAMRDTIEGWMEGKLC